MIFMHDKEGIGPCTITYSCVIKKRLTSQFLRHKLFDRLKQKSWDVKYSILVDQTNPDTHEGVIIMS